MKRLPVFETTKYAYKFFFTNFGKFVPLLLQYSGVHILLYAFLYLIKNQFNLSMEELTDVLVSCLLSIVESLTLWLALPIEINVIRAIVNKEKVETHFFKSLLSSRTWRVLRTAILSYLVIFIPFIIAWLISSLSSFFTFQQDHYKLFLSGLIFFGIIQIGYIGMRLFLSIVTAALDHKEPIRDSWKMTKGSLLRILIVSILTILPSILLSVSAWKIFKLPVDLIHTNPLIDSFGSLLNGYFTILATAGSARAYMHLNKSNNDD